jgi:hypothetical protein
MNSDLRNPERAPLGSSAREAGAQHPSWTAFIRFCRELKHGEIERLSIQDGLPVVAATTRRKVKFTA